MEILRSHRMFVTQLDHEGDSSAQFAYRSRQLVILAVVQQCHTHTRSTTLCQTPALVSSKVMKPKTFSVA